MKVWRVAHDTAVRTDVDFPAGPYAYSEALDRDTVDRINGMRWDHSDDMHPNPRMDVGIGSIEGHEVCGLVSREALDRWFEGWATTLAECGFVVYVYEVPDDSCRVGESGQVVFKRKAAVLDYKEALRAEVKA